MNGQIYCPNLPLAVYREVAAHLRQVDTITVDVLPQRSNQFDYLQSQVGGLAIQYHATATAADQAHVEQILAHYGDRYGTWEPISQL